MAAESVSLLHFPVAQAQRVHHDVVDVGLIELADDVLRARAVGSHAELRAVMLRGLFAHVLHRDRAVTQRQPRVVLGAQARGGAHRAGVIGDDLGGVRVVGGNDDLRIAVLLGKVQRGLQRLVQAIHLADHPAHVGHVGPFIDAGALHLEEESLVRVLVVEQVDRLGGHVLELGLSPGVLRGALPGLRLGTTELHLALGKARLHISL